MGLLVLLLLKQREKQVVLVGGRDHRLRLAVVFGAAQTLNYHFLNGEPVDAIRQQTGRMFPTIVEASGSHVALSNAIRLVNCEGRILVLGDYGSAHAHFPWNELLHREIELIGSNASTGAWDEAVYLAVHGNLPRNRLVTHRLPADRFEEGFLLMRDRGAPVVKIVLEW